MLLCSAYRTQPEESPVVHFVNPLYEFKSLHEIIPNIIYWDFFLNTDIYSYSIKMLFAVENVALFLVNNLLFRWCFYLKRLTVD